MKFFKYAVLILTLSHVSVAQGQNVELLGKYGASFIGGETIEFVGKDSFHFSGFYCTYGVKGKGTCEIRRDFLYLYFEKSKLDVKEEVLHPDLVSSTPAYDTILKIHLTCLDNMGTPLPFVTVMVKLPFKAALGITSDRNGKAEFKLQNSNQPITITSSAVGIKSRELKIDGSLNYEINLFHLQGFDYDKVINNGQVWVYEIDELSVDFILMRPEGSSETFRKYRKKVN